MAVGIVLLLIGLLLALLIAVRNSGVKALETPSGSTPLWQLLVLPLPFTADF